MPADPTPHVQGSGTVCEACDGTGKFYSRDVIEAEGGADPGCAVCDGTGRILMTEVEQASGVVSVATAVDALTDVLVEYDVPTARIVAEFLKLLADPVYADA